MRTLPNNAFSSYLCTNSIICFFINSSLLCIILFHLPHNFCILSTLQLQTVHTPLFFTQHPIILQYTYLPTSLPILHFTPPPSVLSSLPVSSCLSPPDGIIPVILSHYRSSDANGYTANPAAGSLDQCPPVLPSSVTAVPSSVVPV